jgi:hypothetical protein
MGGDHHAHVASPSVTETSFDFRVPPISMVAAACLLNCLLNAIFNILTDRAKIPWGKYLSNDPTDLKTITSPPTFASSSTPVAGTPAFGLHLLNASSSPGNRGSKQSGMHVIEFGEPSSGLEMEPLLSPQAAGAIPPPASRKENILTAEEIFTKAQMLAFHMNVQYTLLCVLKSIVMVVVVYYHFNLRGGWHRFVVCSAAFLSSGQMSPAIQYITKYFLPLDTEYFRKSETRETAGTATRNISSNEAAQLGAELDAAEKKNAPSGIFLVEVMIQLGAFDLHDFETALFSGSTFVALTIVVLPPVATFCFIGFLMYAWVFLPALLMLMQLRRSFYQRLVQRRNVLLSAAAGCSPRRIFFQELAEALLCRFATAFVALWMLQTSYMLGVGVWSYGSKEYFRVLLVAMVERIEWSGYWNVVLVDTFQRLCFVTQLLF